MEFLGLRNKKILVTGASSGIGKETCQLLSSIGADIYITGRNMERLEELRDNCKNVKQLIAADLTDDDSIESLVDSIPMLDGVVNCAGIIFPFPVKFIGEKHISSVFRINFNSQVILNSMLFRKKKIQKSASIVFVSSVSSQFPYEGGALYTSSKAAIEAYSRATALEYAKYSIRSNVVSPGLVKTKIFEKTMEASSKEELENYEKNYPLGYGDPIDVANSIVFLLSARSRWITGQNIILDGGLTLGSK
ncbi:MAG: SDR family NAD(P)-dependent oxidoreductase [Flavobacteriales bacterium]|nr:SDR family NAD(P)-dependent oxidoreductase [Flavobacteriales bacterium]